MDPITFSIIRHRLFRVIDEAVITLKHVSGSAITNEGHDLMVSLYRADGSLLMGGVGFLHHLTSAAEACKAVIRRFEGDIGEGDVFLTNCPYTAALHTSDIYLVAPIHHEGRLVAWSACFVHVYDIGAMVPGGFSPDSRDIFTEGFSSPGIRLVEGGTMRRDIMDTLLNMVRAPEMVALDLSSMIAANNVARERMVALIEKYGADPVDRACAALVDQSETLFRKRLRELPDGRWESRQYFDIEGETCKVLLAMTKEGDELTFDFTGSSPQSHYGINCTYWASWGGFFAPLFPLLCYDITWNDGVLRPIRMIAPEGSVVNCTRPAPVSLATVGAIQSVNNAACTCIAKMLSASETYAKEATAVWHGSHFAIFMFGLNQRRQEAIGILTETFGGAGGARTWADGIDVGGEIPNPIGRMANVETTEATFPVRYLFRRATPDTGGPGALARRQRHRVRPGAARFARGRHQLRGLRQGHRVLHERGAGRRLRRRALRLPLGAQQCGARDRAQRQPLPRLAGRDDRRGGDHLVGSLPPQGRGRALRPLRRRRRLRRPAGARARAGAGRHRGGHGLGGRGCLGLRRGDGGGRGGRGGDARAPRGPAPGASRHADGRRMSAHPAIEGSYAGPRSGPDGATAPRAKRVAKRAERAPGA